MSEPAVTPTPSPSLKRRQSVDRNIENENYPPKKKRESAIRSENNLKMLIQNGQVDTHKQKVSPKKIKEARTGTFANLISAGKDKLDKFYIRTVATASHGSREDVETNHSDTESLPQPNKIRSEKPKSKSLNTTNTLKVQNLINSSNFPNLTITILVPNKTTTTRVSNPNIIPNVSISTKVPNQTNISNVSNKISTTNVSKSEKTNRETPALLDNYETSNTCELVDDSIAEVSSTNSLDQTKEEETDFDLNRSSLDAEVLALHELILTLAADKDDNGTENHKTVDIRHIEDIYETVLKVKSKLDDVYKQKSIKLRKSFESIQLFVPELKRGLILPTLQELKEKSFVTGGDN